MVNPLQVVCKHIDFVGSSDDSRVQQVLRGKDL